MRNISKYLLIFPAAVAIGTAGYLVYRYFILERVEKETRSEVKQFVDETGADVSFDLNVFTNEGGVFNQDEVVGKVGEIEVAGRTLNLCVWGQIGGNEDFGEYGSLENVLNYCKELWQERLVWLQEYMDNGVNISQESNESIKQLISLSDEAKESALYNNVSTVDFEYISMWYRNISDPAMGVDIAREVVKSKMDRIREDLITGNLLNLEQARNRVLSDTAQKEIDIAYEQNAYFKGESIIYGELDKYFEQEVVNIIQGLSIGEYSEVIETNEIIGGTGGTGKLFLILRVNAIDGKEFRNVDDKLQNLISQYPAEWKF